MSDHITREPDRYGRQPWSPGALDRIAWLTSRLKGKAKVLAALVWFAGRPDYIARPGMAELRKALGGMDRRAIQRYLRDLENDGSIVAVAHSKGGRGNATEYLVNYQRAVVSTALFLPERAVDSVQKGGNFRPKGRLNLPPLPEEPEEPEENPSSSSSVASRKATPKRAARREDEEEEDSLAWNRLVREHERERDNCGPEFVKYALAEEFQTRTPSALANLARGWEEPMPRPKAEPSKWRCNGCGEIAEHADGGLCHRCLDEHNVGRTA